MSERHLRLVPGEKSDFSPNEGITKGFYEHYFMPSSKPTGELSDLISRLPRGHTIMSDILLRFDFLDSVTDNLKKKIFSTKYTRVDGESTATNFEITTSNFRSEDYFKRHPDNFKIHKNLERHIEEAMPTRTVLERSRALDIFEVGRYCGRLVHDEFADTTQDVFKLRGPIGCENFYRLLFKEKADDLSLGSDARIIYYKQSQPERFATKMGNVFLQEFGYDEDEITALNDSMKKSAKAEAKKGIDEGMMVELGAVYPMDDREFSIVLQQLVYYPEENDASVRDLF